MDEQAIDIIAQWASGNGVIWGDLSRGEKNELLRNVVRAIQQQEKYISTLEQRIRDMEARNG